MARTRWGKVGTPVVPPGPSTVDLHTHTLRSDGVLSPHELVAAAAAGRAVPAFDGDSLDADVAWELAALSSAGGDSLRIRLLTLGRGLIAAAGREDAQRVHGQMELHRAALLVGDFAAGVLHGFEDHAGHGVRALEEDGLLDAVGGPAPERLGGARLHRFPDSEVSFQIDENIRGTDIFGLDFGYVMGVGGPRAQRRPEHPAIAEVEQLQG